MRGRYYAKHTINHFVDNQLKIKKLNENYKSVIKRNAINHLKNDIPLNERVAYLRGLTHDVYRYGRKYKYKCNLTASDISYIIRSINDDELHVAYFGMTVKEYNSDNLGISIAICVVFAFIIILFKACST